MPTRPTRFDPGPLPQDVAGPLRDALVVAHEREPFGPHDVRGSARRVVEVVRGLHREPLVVRGVVDLGGAEVDHLFVVVGERVVDVALPLGAPGFSDVLRAWVAGDVDTDELVAAAAGHDLEERVLGAFEEPVAYRGTPVWGGRAA